MSKDAKRWLFVLICVIVVIGYTATSALGMVDHGTIVFPNIPTFKMPLISDYRSSGIVDEPCNFLKGPVREVKV